MDVSVCVPYRDRLTNLRLALESLTRQSLSADRIEVVIGAMEYSTDFLELCREYSDRLDLVAVVTGREFHIPHARNLAMRSARRDVVVQMDADTLLDEHALKRVVANFEFGQRQCVLGQVVGYGNNQDGDVADVQERNFDQYAADLAAMAVSEEWPADPRFQVPHHVPWMFAWTGLVALMRRDVVEADLYFDESFRGWGVDDLEWGYRVCRAGIPIERRSEVYALHLPHQRDSKANEHTESRNYHRFLRKWPHRDVELARFLGDTEANQTWPDYRDFMDQFASDGGLGVQVSRDRGGQITIVVGARRPIAGSDDHYWELTGMSLPFSDHEVARCELDPRLGRLPSAFREAVVAEAQRVTAGSVAGADPTWGNASTPTA